MTDETAQAPTTQPEPVDRLQLLLTDMQHAAMHNAPVTTAMINEMASLIEAIRT